MPTPKPKPNSIRVGLPMRTPSGRLRQYNFTHLWCRDVLLGRVRDHDKLIAHGVHLLMGTRSQLAEIPFQKLLFNVQYVLRKQILEDNRKRNVIENLE